MNFCNKKGRPWPPFFVKPKGKEALSSKNMPFEKKN
jgi:hypothetical protein